MTRHGAWREDEVDRVAEDLAPAALEPHAARPGHDDDLRVAPDRLVDDGAADVPGARDAADHGHAVRVADRARLVELLVRLRTSSGSSASSGRSSGTSIAVNATIDARRSAASRHAKSIASSEA